MGDSTDRDEHALLFQPSGARGHVAGGTRLRAAARQLGVEIESVCAENATCGKCRVLVEEGRRSGLTSSVDHLAPMGAAERDFLARRQRTWERTGLDPERLRLACQAEITGDLAVFVPESSRGNRQIVRKSAGDRAIDLKPMIRWYYVELDPPTLDHPEADVERVADAVAAAMETVHQSSGPAAGDPAALAFDHPVLTTLARAVREGDWKVSVAVWGDREVVDVRAGYHDRAFGAAVDVGSTAIALYLCDLSSGELVATESMMNPQTAFGDDVMSRMSHEIENEDGLASLNEAVVGAVNALVARACRAARISADHVLEIVAVGNTTMHHFLLGLPTEHLALAPYVPTMHRSLDVKARDLGIEIGRSANVHLLPVVASFVGADNMAVLLAERPHDQDREVLVIDVGTNAELVFGNRERLVCTSTPTGPAFEGAHIEYGMRAAPGAIERVSIDPETLEPSFEVIGDGVDVKGICGTAIVDAVAELFRTGIIDARGRFVEPAGSDRVRRGEFGMEYVIAREDETSIGRDIPITTRDIRQIQLAKAALYSAARILMREAGVEKPDGVVLAGAFGSSLDPTNVLVLGMIPDCPLDEVRAVGNAAGDGARIALLDRTRREEAAHLAGRIRRVELPVDPEFQNEYMLALNFPHMAHEFPSIADLIPDHGPDPLAPRFMDASPSPQDTRLPGGVSA